MPGHPSRPRRGAGAAVRAILLFWLLIILLAAGIVFGLAAVRQSDRILAGVQSGSSALGGLQVDVAAALLQSNWQSHKIILATGEQSWTLSPSQVGVVLDADATVQEAYRRGRGTLTTDNALSTAQRLLATTGLVPLAVDPIQVEPIWHFDRDAAAETLRKLSGQLEILPQDAGVQVIDGRVTATPASVGQALDIAAMLATLEQQPWQTTLAHPSSSAALRFTLPIVQRPPAITDVSAVVNQVAPLLASPIRLQLYDAIRDEHTTWTVSPVDMGQWLSFQITNTQTNTATLNAPAREITWSVNETQVAEFVAARNATFGDERYVASAQATKALIEAFKSRQPEIRLEVSHGERVHVVKSGETLSSIAYDYGMPYPWLLKANPKISDTLFVGDKITIPSPDALLPLPAVENKRIKVSLKGQRVQAFENGQLKWDWKASTGIASSPTSPGVFQVQTHEQMAYAGVWNLYMPWFMGIYRPVPDQDFMNGFHGFPSRDQRQILWTSNLGHQVTYGCILVSTDNAKLLYDWAEAGVVVEITP